MHFCNIQSSWLSFSDFSKFCLFLSIWDLFILLTKNITNGIDIGNTASTSRIGVNPNIANKQPFFSLAVNANITNAKEQIYAPNIKNPNSTSLLTVAEPPAQAIKTEHTIEVNTSCSTLFLPLLLFSFCLLLLDLIYSYILLNIISIPINNKVNIAWSARINIIFTP